MARRPALLAVEFDRGLVTVQVDQRESPSALDARFSYLVHTRRPPLQTQQPGASPPPPWWMMPPRLPTLTSRSSTVA